MAQPGEVFNCTVQETVTQILCSDGLEYVEYEPPLSPTDVAFWVSVAICIFLVLMAGLMSGLTIGLVSMDTMTLAVLTKSGSPKDSVRATKLLPLVRQHHLLLVTLLLANAICMEALPIFLDRLVSPVAAIGISVTAVLFFGEIIPQALCTRFGLAIGANLVYLVWTIIFIFFPIAWPISLLLDWMLGHSTGRYYRRRELVELVRLHELHTDDNEEPLHADEVQMIQGALELTALAVRNAMTPLSAVVSVAADDPVDDALIAKIVRAGHSRLPVHEPGRPDRFVGILLTKSLLARPVDATGAPARVRDLPLRPVMTVSPGFALYDLLHQFETGHSHMAVVAGPDPTVAIPSDDASLGIVTMEDVIEALLQSEIQDEAELERLQRQVTEDDKKGLPRRSFRPRGASYAAYFPAVPSAVDGPGDGAIAPPVYGVAESASAPASRPWASWRLPWSRGRSRFSAALTTGLLSVAPEYATVPHDSRDRSASAESGGANDYPGN